MERIRKKPIQIYRYIQMFSKNSHAYRAHAHTVPVKDLLFHLYHLYLYMFGQWTVMDSSFLKSLTGTARTCGTRDKFHDFTVHYCPLSICMGGGGWRMFPRIFTRTAGAVRVKRLLFILHPPPPICRNTTVPDPPVRPINFKTMRNSGKMSPRRG